MSHVECEVSSNYYPLFKSYVSQLLASNMNGNLTPKGLGVLNSQLPSYREAGLVPGLLA